MPTPKFTTEILAAAIAGFEQQRRVIDTKIAGLKAMMQGDADPTTSPATVAIPAPRKKMSAAARKRIGAAVRKAALARKAAAPQQEAAAPKIKRRISPEGIKRIREANKRRWALKKAAKV